MSLGKSDDFIADVERQYEWYADNANWDVAERSLPQWKPLAGCSKNIRNSDREAGSVIRACVTGDFLSCFVPLRNTFCSTK
jgi:hypothetical protein